MQKERKKRIVLWLGKTLPRLTIFIIDTFTSTSISTTTTTTITIKLLLLLLLSLLRHDVFMYIYFLNSYVRNVRMTGKKGKQPEKRMKVTERLPPECASKWKNASEKECERKKERMKEQQTISVRSSSCRCAPVCVKIQIYAAHTHLLTYG